MNRRAEILQELVKFEQPTKLLMMELSCFGWDWEGPPLLVLTREHLLRIIDRFLRGEISATQLNEWAQNLEVREDVAFEEAEAELLNDVFFRIATPEINEPLTQQSVQQMRNELARGAGKTKLTS